MEFSDQIDKLMLQAVFINISVISAARSSINAFSEIPFTGILYRYISQATG